jgi:hypothetical protein
MPNLNHLTHGISNLVSLIIKIKLGLSLGRPVAAGRERARMGCERDRARLGHACCWAERREKKRESARATDFVFLFQNYE